MADMDGQTELEKQDALNDSDDEASKAKPKPTAKAWAKMEALWALGDVTRAEIATTLGVSPTAVSAHMKKRKILRGSKADERRMEVVKKITESDNQQAVQQAARINATKDEHYRFASSIASYTYKTIAALVTDKITGEVANRTLKNFDLAMGILVKARSERWVTLGLDRPDSVDPNELPTLSIEELTAHEIEELQNRHFNSNALDYMDDENEDDKESEPE